MKKNLSWPIIGGHIVECFDNTLYGFFAVMLAPLFFPSSDPKIQELSSFCAFAAGYITRPLGAFIFGLVGDRRGRKSPLLYAMMLVGIPTFLMGCVPTYEKIGLAAPMLLVILRLIQGVFYGAEFPGVNIYLYETFSKEVLGRYTGILIASGVFGAVLASVIGAFVTMEIMPSWAWRIPFFVGGLSAFYITFLRRNIIETASYREAQDEKRVTWHPWLEIFMKYKKNCFVAIVICGFTVVPLYTTTFFGNQIFKELGYSTSESLLLDMIALIFNGLGILYSGRLADKLGFHRQLLLGCATVAIVAFPAFWIMSHHLTTWSVFLFIISITVSGTIVNGCAMPYVSNLFPTSCRYSAVGATWTIGMALIGGMTPVISGALLDKYHSYVMPAYWLMGISTLTFILVWLVKDTQSLQEKVKEA